MYKRQLNLLVQSVDLQTSEKAARELFDMLLAEGFAKMGIEDREDYYYSKKVYQSYQTMLTGSLVDTLIVMKHQKEENLEAHRQRLCGQRAKNQKLAAKVEKLQPRAEQLKKIKGQKVYRAIRKMGLLEE